MSLQVRELSPALQKIAKEELNEDPTQIPQMLEQFREWIKKSPHLKSRMDDQFLLSFLRCTKYSLERAKYKLDMFYTIRQHSPEFFKNRDPNDERLRELVKLCAFVPLPKTASDDSPRVIFAQPARYNPSVYKMDEVIKAFMLVKDLLHEDDDQMILAGQIYIVDMNASLSHFSSLSPQIMKKMAMSMQEGSPFRVKAIHYINTPAFFEKIYSIVKQFLSDKIKSRIYFHGSDLESLYKVFPKNILPKEYGGDCDSVENIAKTWEEKVLANRQFLLDQVENYGVDEKKRIGQSKNPENLFGIDGTFRKLDID